MPDLITASGGWNLDLVISMFFHLNASTILQLPIGGIGKPERFAWNYHASGSYTIKFGYLIAHQLGGGCNIGSTTCPGVVILVVILMVVVILIVIRDGGLKILQN